MKLSTLLVCIAVGLLACCQYVQAADDMFCGRSDCYEVLGLKNDANNRDIKKAYYALSIVYHPDKNTAEGAADKFREIAAAYEVLSDENLRKDYDEIIANPNKVMANYARYYRMRFSRKIDARLIVVIFLAIITFLHWFLWRQQYYATRKELANHPVVLEKMAYVVKLRNAEQNGNQAPVTLDDIDLSAVLDIRGRDSRLPTIRDLLLWEILWLPVYISDFFVMQVRWLIKFTLLKHPYSIQEREVLTAHAIGFTMDKWHNVLTDQEQWDYLEKDLWIPANLASYRAAQIREYKMKKSKKY